MASGTGAPADGAGRLIARRYRLVAPIERGGMGAVWRAVDEMLDRDVAVKEVHLPAGIPAEDRDELRERSLREARITARLRHPSVVTLYDVVVQDGRPWLVMELVQSESLQAVTERSPLPPARGAEIGLAVLGALQVAHQAGVLHRDVKPSNVLLSEDGRVVLTDFGIARYEGDTRLTMPGRIMGSAGYIAPELTQGQKGATPAADLWSLGATLYLAVEGRPPYVRDSILGMLTAAATEDPAPMQLAGPLTPVIEGLMARDPAERIDAQTAERMLTEAARQIALDDAGADMVTRRVGRRETRSGRKADRGGLAGRAAGAADAADTAAATSSAPRRRRVALVTTLLALAIAGAGAAGAAYLNHRASQQAAAADPAPPPTIQPTSRPSHSVTASPSPTQSITPPVSPPPATPSLRIPLQMEPVSDYVVRFAINFPSRWTSRESGLEASTLLYQPGIEPPPDLLISNDARLDYTDPLVHAREVEKDYISKDKPVNYRRISMKPVRVGGAQAADWEYTYVRDGVLTHVRARFVVSYNGLKHVIRLRLPADSWAVNEAVREHIFASFRSKPPTPG